MTVGAIHPKAPIFYYYLCVQQLLMNLQNNAREQ